MRKKIVYSLIILSVLCLLLMLLCACQSDGNVYSGVKVVYELEGGKYKNSEIYVQYYSFEAGTQNLIKPLQYWEDGESKFSREGYDFVGWYRTKDENGNYSDKWDFDADTVGDEGVTLYAKWEAKKVYKFEIYNYDDRDNAAAQVIKTVESYENGEFDFRERNLPKKAGYTYLEMYVFDEESQSYIVWNSDSYQSDGDKYITTAEEPVVRMYAKFLEGEWNVVKTANDLRSAMQKNISIYLYCNIDLEGQSLCFDSFNGETQQKEFCGNGFVVSNFTVSYDDSKSAIDLSPDYTDSSKKCLSVGLFVNPSGLYVHDVEFDGMKIDIDTNYDAIKAVYIAPIAVSATDFVLENVTVKGEIVITKLPSDVLSEKEEYLAITTETPCFADYCSGEYSTENFASEIVVTDNTVAAD